MAYCQLRAEGFSLRANRVANQRVRLDFVIVWAKLRGEA
jgi:hypothetical protein